MPAALASSIDSRHILAKSSSVPLNPSPRCASCSGVKAVHGVPSGWPGRYTPPRTRSASGTITFRRSATIFWPIRVSALATSISSGVGGRVIGGMSWPRISVCRVGWSSCSCRMLTPPGAVIASRTPMATWPNGGAAISASTARRTCPPASAACAGRPRIPSNGAALGAPPIGGSLYSVSNRSKNSPVSPSISWPASVFGL